ncbi:MAG: hypothetical protein HY363_05120 [Candidatus Aenigmarchaeota archaeon]|nr:hypothetical protein [Candidatus Aenigmarchaeota archaeon]
MSFARLAGVGGVCIALFSGFGCSSSPERLPNDLSSEDSASGSSTEQSSVRAERSIEEILEACAGASQLYAHSDPVVAENRFSENHEQVLDILTDYLPRFYDDSSSISQSQRIVLASAYNDLGRACLLEEMYSQASDAFCEAIRLGLKNSRVYFDCATALYEVDCKMFALYYFEKCFSLDRMNFVARQMARRIAREMHLPVP